MVDNANIVADTLGNKDGAPTGIDIQVAEEVVITNGAVVTTDVLGAGDAGNIQVTTNRMELSNGVLLGSRSFDSGNAGDIAIAVTGDTVRLDRSFISSSTSGAGNAGTIAVTGDTVTPSCPPTYR